MIMFDCSAVNMQFHAITYVLFSTIFFYGAVAKTPGLCELSKLFPIPANHTMLHNCTPVTQAAYERQYQVFNARQKQLVAMLDVEGQISNARMMLLFVQYEFEDIVSQLSALPLEGAQLRASRQFLRVFRAIVRQMKHSNSNLWQTACNAQYGSVLKQLKPFLMVPPSVCPFEFAFLHI